MIQRRGFLGKLAGLLGLAALPVKPAEPEPIEIKKGTVIELPNGWVVTQYSYQRTHKGD